MVLGVILSMVRSRSSGVVISWEAIARYCFRVTDFGIDTHSITHTEVRVKEETRVCLIDTRSPQSRKKVGEGVFKQCCRLLTSSIYVMLCHRH